MKKVLLFLLISIAVQGFAQNYPVTGINITLSGNPDPNTANWGTGTSMLIITASTQALNGRVAPHVMESKLLVTIKKGGSKVCGSYTNNSAPASNFNTITKVWSGTNAVSYLGKECVLTPGDYELCVRFFGDGPVGLAPLCDEKCKPFTIIAHDQQSYQAPQPVAPANESELSESARVQPIIFRWIPVTPRPQEPVTYRLKVWQLMQGQNGTQAMNVNQPVFTKEVENITQTVVTNLLTGSCTLPNLCSFIWNVQAIGREEKPIGENSGISIACLFNFRNETADGTQEETDEKACKNFGVEFMQDRKIYRGDSVSMGFDNDIVEKRKIYTGDSVLSSLDNVLMGKRKIYKGDSISYNCSIFNNYDGREVQNKPKSFRITIKGYMAIVAAENAPRGWARTP